MSRRVTLLAVVVAALCLGAAAPSIAQAQSCSGPYLVEQAFPTSGPEETRWRICWQPQKQFGPVITAAFFRPSPGGPWIRILWDARVGEIFVPYHNGTRFFDVKQFNWDWVKLAPADCPAGAGGTLLGPGPDVCKQVGDRGLAWKLDGKRRRGQQLELWGALAAANYNYVIRWIFRDDGMIQGSVGATGANLPTHPHVAHLHSPTWRLDIDLDGWPSDSAHLGVHTDQAPAPTAVDSVQAIPVEAGLVWDPARFHGLHIFDANLKNSRGNASMLHLMPLRYGTPRNAEAVTKNDFWVTRYHPDELYAADLPSFLNGESTAATDIVVWYQGSIHHLVRDEDRTASGGWMALLMENGFQLKPHNLFGATPLYP